MDAGHSLVLLRSRRIAVYIPRLSGHLRAGLPAGCGLCCYTFQRMHQNYVCLIIMALGQTDILGIIGGLHTKLTKRTQLRVCLQQMVFPQPTPKPVPGHPGELDFQYAG